MRGRKDRLEERKSRFDDGCTNDRVRMDQVAEGTSYEKRHIDRLVGWMCTVHACSHANGGRPRAVYFARNARNPVLRGALYYRCGINFNFAPPAISTVRPITLATASRHSTKSSFPYWVCNAFIIRMNLRLFNPRRVTLSVQIYVSGVKWNLLKNSS